MFVKTLHPEQAKLRVLDLQEGDPEAGVLEGYAAVFGNVDNGKEVVMPGAFTKTIKERLKKRQILLYDTHAFYEGTAAVIGIVEEAKEDDYGLLFKARFSAVTRAQEIRTKIREQILTALSFGYDVIKADQDEKTGVRYLKELRLYEVSVVPWGMNPKALIDRVKGQPAALIPTDLDAEDTEEAPIVPPPPPVVEGDAQAKAAMGALLADVESATGRLQAKSLLNDAEELVSRMNRLLRSN